MTGHLAPTLTVTNLERSVGWLLPVLDLTVRRAYEPSTSVSATPAWSNRAGPRELPGRVLRRPPRSNEFHLLRAPD
jgi:hypothetical protein